MATPLPQTMSHLPWNTGEEYMEALRNRDPRALAWHRRRAAEQESQAMFGRTPEQAVREGILNPQLVPGMDPNLAPRGAIGSPEWQRGDVGSQQVGFGPRSPAQPSEVLGGLANVASRQGGPQPDQLGYTSSAAMQQLTGNQVRPQQPSTTMMNTLNQVSDRFQQQPVRDFARDRQFQPNDRQRMLHEQQQRRGPQYSPVTANNPVSNIFRGEQNKIGGMNTPRNFGGLIGMLINRGGF